MLDAKRLLDQFLGGQSGQTPVVGGSSGQTSGRPGDWGNQIGELARGLGGRGLGGIGGGALAGGLAGILLGSKTGRKLAGSALTMGGLAVVGALAYQAYKNWQAGKSQAGTQPTSGVPMLPPPADSPFNPSREADQQAVSRNLLRAMIGAAKADGHIDTEEQTKIFAEIDKLSLDDDDKAFVMEELRAPLDVDAIAGATRNPEEAAEIYAASLLAINIDNAAERGYLGLLAARLGLDEKLVEHLHATVANATEAVPSSLSSNADR